VVQSRRGLLEGFVIVQFAVTCTVLVASGLLLVVLLGSMHARI
jgi:hypothetical protein